MMMNKLNFLDLIEYISAKKGLILERNKENKRKKDAWKHKQFDDKVNKYNDLNLDNLDDSNNVVSKDIDKNENIDNDFDNQIDINNADNDSNIDGVSTDMADKNPSNTNSTEENLNSTAINQPSDNAQNKSIEWDGIYRTFPKQKQDTTNKIDTKKQPTKGKGFLDRLNDLSKTGKRMMQQAYDSNSSLVDMANTLSQSFQTDKNKQNTKVAKKSISEIQPTYNSILSTIKVGDIILVNKNLSLFNEVKKLINAKKKVSETNKTIAKFFNETGLDLGVEYVDTPFDIQTVNEIPFRVDKVKYTTYKSANNKPLQQYIQVYMFPQKYIEQRIMADDMKSSCIYFTGDIDDNRNIVVCQLLGKANAVKMDGVVEQIDGKLVLNEIEENTHETQIPK